MLEPLVEEICNVNFNAENLALGVYIYQLKVNDYAATKKLVFRNKENYKQMAAWLF